MAPSSFLPPDVLVLGAGGVAGEAWLSGVLAGLEDAADIDVRDCEHFIGTSAGSIVSARLAAGLPLRRPPASNVPAATAPSDLPLARAVARRARKMAGAYAGLAAAPAAAATLAAAAPGGALARAAALRALPRPTERLQGLRQRVSTWGPQFDGRLRVVALDRLGGRRVVFGSPGAPKASVAEAVEASCTVPWIFAPVVIGGREYVDGGAWSATNLDVAPAGRDTQVLCLVPTGAIGASRNALGVVRTALRGATTLEALTLRRRGARVRIVAPDGDSSRAIGGRFMDPRVSGAVLAAGYAQGQALART